MAAGHNALRGPGPSLARHSEIRWHKWVVPIPGSTGIRLTSQLPFPTGWRADKPHVQEVTAQAMRATLLANATGATLAGRRSSKRASHGRCAVPCVSAYPNTDKAPMVSRMRK
jgi:hypothetical protein